MKAIWRTCSNFFKNLFAKLRIKKLFYQLLGVFFWFAPKTKEQQEKKIRFLVEQYNSHKKGWLVNKRAGLFKFFKYAEFLIGVLSQLYLTLFYLKIYLVTTTAPFSRSFTPNRQISLKNIVGTPGIFDFFKKFKLTFVALLVGFFLLALLAFNHLISTQKILAFWFLAFLNIYWLLSTFVFFNKKYYWGKFTTANQRFWKRTLLLFWILEFFLFFIFLYLTCNANSESYFMLDQLQIYKKFLSPIRVFIVNLSVTTVLILLVYLTMLSLKWQFFNKITLFYLVISNILGFILFFECYQFFHLINYYSNVYWEYDQDMEVWLIEFEARKTRTHHHYSILLGILKFWHIIFIVGVWVFFFLRSLEIGRFRYPNIAANLQNFLFLYVFNWIILFPWVKFFLKYFAAYTYTNLFIHFRAYSTYYLFSDLSVWLEPFVWSEFIFTNYFYFQVYDYIYWCNFIF